MRRTAGSGHGAGCAARAARRSGRGPDSVSTRHRRVPAADIRLFSYAKRTAFSHTRTVLYQWAQRQGFGRSLVDRPIPADVAIRLLMAGSGVRPGRRPVANFRSLRKRILFSPVGGFDSDALARVPRPGRRASRRRGRGEPICPTEVFEVGSGDPGRGRGPARPVHRRGLVDARHHGRSAEPRSGRRAGDRVPGAFRGAALAGNLRRGRAGGPAIGGGSAIPGCRAG